MRITHPRSDHPTAIDDLQRVIAVDDDSVTSVPYVVSEKCAAKKHPHCKLEAVDAAGETVKCACLCHPAHTFLVVP